LARKAGGTKEGFKPILLILEVCCNMVVRRHVGIFKQEERFEFSMVLTRFS